MPQVVFPTPVTLNSTQTGPIQHDLIYSFTALPQRSYDEHDTTNLAVDSRNVWMPGIPSTQDREGRRSEEHDQQHAKPRSLPYLAVCLDFEGFDDGSPRCIIKHCIYHIL
jgi:hypothetical protein